MNFKQLEVFVSVVKFHSFSRAAEEIFLSQPTVSAHIHALEAECGAQLLVRSTKEVYPTQAGMSFYRYANELLQMREQALSAVRGCVSDVRGTLEIAASTVPSQYLLPAVFSHMADEYPDLFFSLQEYDSREAIQRVINMQAEISVVGTHPEDLRCVSVPFLQDRLVLITPNADRFRALTAKNALDLLKSEPFLTREQGSGTRLEMEDALRRLGIDSETLHLRAQLNNTESIKQAVAHGLGISIVSRFAAEDYVRFGSLLMFDLGDPVFDRQFYFVYRRGWPLSPAAERFMETARKLLIASDSEKTEYV